MGGTELNAEAARLAALDDDRNPPFCHRPPTRERFRAPIRREPLCFPAGRRDVINITFLGEWEHMFAKNQIAHAHSPEALVVVPYPVL